MNVVKLRTENLLLVFSKDNGSLIQVKSNISGWVFHRRAELGLSWRLQVPLNEELKNNAVLGEEQILSGIQENKDEVIFTWNNVRSKRTGILDISVTITVRIEDGQVVWYTEINNQSPYVVESVYSPYIGDVTPPDQSKLFEVFFESYNSKRTLSLWPVFEDNCGYWGVDYGTQYIKGVPEAPYVLLNNGKEGMYFGVKTDSCEMVSWHSELRPGYENSMDYKVPKEIVVNDEKVHIRFAAIHMPYIMPKEKRNLTPIIMDTYKGTWHYGTDIYKKWIEKYRMYTTANIPEWVLKPNSWLQFQMNSPEDELRMKFKELPGLAEECRKYGISAIQLVGWNYGGQDQNNPLHDPDHRLGTFEELKEAISKCQNMGIKIILFTKFTWADQATEWFRKELIKYSIKNPYGDYYWTDGYYYQTPAEQLGISSKPLIPMCFGSKEYLDICVNEFKKLIALNCDGILYDECQHHGPAYLCFDSTHEHRLGFPVYQNDRLLVREMSETAGMRKDFLFSGEACYDWEATCYGLSYHRSQDAAYVPVTRYTRPFWPMMTAVTGFNDRNMINQCLLYRFLISYEPYNFKGKPCDCGRTIEYGNKVDEFRMKYKEYVWDAEFQDKKGAVVQTREGEEFYSYAVYRTEKRRYVLVLANYSETQTICLNAKLENEDLNRYRLVEDESWKEIADGIVIPPLSAALAISITGKQGERCR